MTEIKFKNEKTFLVKSRYTTKPKLISLRLLDSEGFPYMSITKNLDNKILSKFLIKEDYAIVKDYAENEGILQHLIDNKIVEDTKQVIISGFCVLNIVRVLI